LLLYELKSLGGGRVANVRKVTQERGEETGISSTRKTRLKRELKKSWLKFAIWGAAGPKKENNREENRKDRRIGSWENSGGEGDYLVQRKKEKKKNYLLRLNKKKVLRNIQL